MRDGAFFAEAAALRRIARVLLKQVKQGGPSNFEQVADRYLEGDDLRIFRDLVDGVRWVHLDGTECVAGWDVDTGDCTEGGGPVLSRRAFNALVTP